LPLPTATAARWRSSLELAWALLLRSEPSTAEAMRRGLLTLTPLPPKERYRPQSVTAEDGFGGVMASAPDDPVQLAVTLVHEFQHTKLGALMHLAPLYTPAPPSVTAAELFYAPWRNDPRPLRGLLQGIYAFMGVTRFWRTHQDAAPSAQFEFALWRAQLWSTLELLHQHPRLTPLGLRFLAGLREQCGSWLADPLPAEPLTLAESAAADHRARWRAHHLRPSPDAVSETARAWLRGDPHPPTALATTPPALVPDPSARWLDSAATLARQRLEGAEGAVSGTSAGDVLLAGGDTVGARGAYEAELAGSPEARGAWVGLGRALAGASADADSDAARLLGRYPERACAVRGVLRVGVDPVRLAGWLGSAG
jgi:hypothetical protein